jgi:ribosomal protein S18 acetylase RimI-like enzyme
VQSVRIDLSLRYNARMSRFNLPLLKSQSKAQSPDDLVRLAIHAEEIYESAPAEKESLDFGLAVFSKEFSNITGANHVRDVSTKIETPPEEMIAQVEDFYRARDLICRQWIFDTALVPEKFRAPLEARGFAFKKSNLHRLETPGRFENARRDLTVIPGRASFAKLQELEDSCERAWGTTNETTLAQCKAASIRYLDDPQVDNLLILDGQTPVATAYLVTAGECGMIQELYVHPHHVRKHIATTLMERIIELAARSRLRHVLLFCDDGNTAAQALYEKSGFKIIRACECMSLPLLDNAE